MKAKEIDIDLENYCDTKKPIYEVIRSIDVNNLDVCLEHICGQLVKLCLNFNLNLFFNQNEVLIIAIDNILTELKCKMSNIGIKDYLLHPLLAPFVEAFVDSTLKMVLLKTVSVKCKIMMATTLFKACFETEEVASNPVFAKLSKASPYFSVLYHLVDFPDDIDRSDKFYSNELLYRYVYLIYLVYYPSYTKPYYPIVLWEKCWNDYLFCKCLNLVDEILCYKIKEFDKIYNTYITSSFSLKKLMTFKTSSVPKIKSEDDVGLFIFLFKTFCCFTFLEANFRILPISSNNLSESAQGHSRANSNNSISNKPSSDKEFWLNYTQYPDVISHLLTYAFALLSNSLTSNDTVIMHLILLIFKKCSFEKWSCQILYEHITENVVVYLPVHEYQKLAFLESAITPHYMVYYVFNLVNLLMAGHLKTKIPLVLFIECLKIIKNCLCVQIEIRARITQFNFVSLYSALFSLMNFVCNHHVSENRKSDEASAIFALIGTIFDTLVCHGDVILNTPEEYDSLLYEIIRNSNLISSAVKLISNELSDMSIFSNCNSVIFHFLPILSKNGENKNMGCLNTNETLSIIKKNYDGLQLQNNFPLSDSYFGVDEYSLPDENIHFLKRSALRFLEVTKKFYTDLCKSEFKTNSKSA